MQITVAIDLTLNEMLKKGETKTLDTLTPKVQETSPTSRKKTVSGTVLLLPSSNGQVSFDINIWNNNTGSDLRVQESIRSEKIMSSLSWGADCIGMELWYVTSVTFSSSVNPSLVICLFSRYWCTKESDHSASKYIIILQEWQKSLLSDKSP